ncbi:MAG: hypothetical protein CMB99_03595 [Flavobacteriaceae bacterium]|nr:hypothetical protein [Flavobacteriaceae bacterium]|tara:strand:+ start:136692 stop:136925 length:234 start_codon:yes stop_codon:yes gene_type:complete
MNKLLKVYKSGLGFGIFMFFGMTIIWPLIDGEPITLKTTLFGLIWWVGISSFFYGWINNLNLFKGDNSDSEDEISSK